jgi:hypothetical protein
MHRTDGRNLKKKKPVFLTKIGVGRDLEPDSLTGRQIAAELNIKLMKNASVARTSILVAGFFLS